ncbi:MAG: electron transfer flavoprotein subunit alpha/FixB family protein, partial [Gemmatimonadales bacterium]|nr:electron transfer flavoprotein subunit alpha/FixB family protein [Gemmatimonadales bacterium]
AAELARARGAAAVVVAASATGRDLAPRLAARLGAGFAADCTALRAEGGAVVAVRPVYAGKALQTVKLPGMPAVVSVRTGAFAPAARAHVAAVEAVAVPAVAARMEVVERRAAAAQRLDVAEAEIIVAGGRGLGEPAHFRLVEELAAAFGDAAVGASRAVVDAGWRDHAEQVGQTGKTVSPRLYIAVGISGAIQHLAGMRTARTIVAVNKDKDAPIFKVADYGIVGDLFEVLPALTAAIRARRS